MRPPNECPHETNVASSRNAPLIAINKTAPNTQKKIEKKKKKTKNHQTCTSNNCDSNAHSYEQKKYIYIKPIIKLTRQESSNSNFQPETQFTGQTMQ